MVTFDKISSVGKLSDCLAREHKVDVVGEEASICMHTALSRSLIRDKMMRSDMFLDSTCCKSGSSPLGAMEAPNESSLFSSSLSDLMNHKLTLSSSRLSPHFSSSVFPHKDEVEPLGSSEEFEEQVIENLPDEDKFFDGIVDGMGQLGLGNGGDDPEDFDVFIGSGGIELDGEERQPPGQRPVGYPWGLHQNQQQSARLVYHASRIHSAQRLSSGSIVGDPSPHETSRLLNGFHSPVRMPSISSEFAHLDANQPYPRVQLENRGLSNFHPHSPQLSLRHNAINSIPQHSFDSLACMADDICSKIPEKVNIDIGHLGLNGPALELHEGGFGYSPNGVRIPQSFANKSNSYQQHHLRSLLIPNSPSFLNNNRGHHLGRLPGSPGTQHLMVTMGSPVHRQLQVGSAPIMNASLWDRQQMYTRESQEAPGYQMGALRSMGIPGFPPSHPREISSHGNISHVTEVSKNGGLQSPQQLGHMFHERNYMNSLPTSFGSPSERVRTRRIDTNLSNADRKHYELNIDRILQGDDSRTTLMIKNIPNKYTSKMLLATIDEHHRGKYDFIYLPIDFKNKCNMGYAFINIIDPIQIVTFHQTIEGRKWEKFNSEKVASLAYARIQGKGALVAHFQNSSLMNEDKRCRPILFHTDGPNAGDQEPFPMGTSFRTKVGRQQAVGGGDEE